MQDWTCSFSCKHLLLCLLAHLQTCKLLASPQQQTTPTNFRGAHLISCSLRQISVVHLTEWTALINSRNNQLWMQSDPWGDYRLLSSDLQHSQQPVPPGRLNPTKAVSQTADMKTAGTTYQFTLPLSCGRYGVTQTWAVGKHAHAHAHNYGKAQKKNTHIHLKTDARRCTQTLYTERSCREDQVQRHYTPGLWKHKHLHKSALTLKCPEDTKEREGSEPVSALSCMG